MTRTVRVLVVDDEPLVRRVIVGWVRRWGYEVEEAGSAVDGLALMEANPAEILIVDLIMPVHGGLWLIERVQQRWPSTSIIVESGSQDETTILRAKQYGAMAFVPKPFGHEMIHQALEQVVRTRLT